MYTAKAGSSYIYMHTEHYYTQMFKFHGTLVNLQPVAVMSIQESNDPESDQDALIRKITSDTN